MGIHRKNFSPIVLTVILGSLLFIVSSNHAYAATSDKSCTKVGVKSGGLICTKVNGKLIWQLIKKSQTITGTSPTQVALAAGTISLDYSASSKLTVNAISSSPAICTISGNVVSLKSLGYCSIRLSQSGNAKFASAPSKELRFLVLGINQISFTLPPTLSLSIGTFPLAGSSSSGQPLVYTSSTPDICSISGSALRLTKIGICMVSAAQGSSTYYEQAQKVEAQSFVQGLNNITFTPSSSLLLSIRTYSLSGTASSGLALTYQSLTSEICSIVDATLTLIKVGTCTMQAMQNGSDFYPAAKPVQASISISETRVTSDQPDTVSGFQVKAIYVVPADGADHFYDTNGYLAGILDEGNKYLSTQMGLRVPIDRTATGYDIEYLKTKLTTSYLLTSGKLDDELFAESLLMENPGVNRKDYIFFVDVDILRDGVNCGYANRPGMNAIVAVGTKCTGDSASFKNWASATWPHELFHNFGVSHSLDNPCDFMSGVETPGTCPWSTPITLDKTRSRYVGSSAQGQNILQLRVWEGYTQRMDLLASCLLEPVPRADGFDYAYCPTGTQVIGPLKYCWQSITALSLEEFVGGVWVSLGSGNTYPQPWGEHVNWSCNQGFTAPWKELNVTTPGISLYRWMVNGRESEQFKVIWVA